MSEVYLISLIVLIASWHLAGGTLSKVLSAGGVVGSDEGSILPLTKSIIKAKNYSRTPKNYQYFGFDIIPKPSIEGIEFEYRFPLVEEIETVYKVVLRPNETISTLNEYGADDSIVMANDDVFFLNPSLSENEKRTRLNRDGFFYVDNDNWGPDYADIALKANQLTRPIASFIERELKKHNKDSYFNRVRAAANFVQHIPFGEPNFDAPGNCYAGIAVPHESFFINYSDCDSKSVFFVSILQFLLPPDSTVLVYSTVVSENIKISGNHVMIGVKDLNCNGEIVNFENNDYTLIETSSPSALGEKLWDAIQIERVKRI